MRIHRYMGHENGLMIMGSKEELADLGHALVAAIPLNTRVDPTVWPPLVAEFKPLSAKNEFKVSFHIDTTIEKPATNFPNKNLNGTSKSIIVKIMKWRKK